MNRYSKLAGIFSLACLLIISCTKNPEPPDNYNPNENEGKPPGMEVEIEGGLNRKVEFKGDCDKVSAKYYPFDLDNDVFRSLIVQGTEAGSSNGNPNIKDGHTLSLALYWQDGHFPEDLIFQLGIDEDATDEDLLAFGNGFYQTSLLNTFESVTYSTSENYKGKVTITSYNKDEGIISGNFQFNARGMIGIEEDGTTATVKGSFVNVPIVDLSDPNNPKGPCFNSQGKNIFDPRENPSNPNNPGNPNNPTNPNNPGNPNQNATNYSFSNKTLTPIEITVNGDMKTIAVNGSVSFSGASNSNFTGTATTSGKTDDGIVVGRLLTWSLEGRFPSTGVQSTDLVAPANMFFLTINNESGRNVEKVYVNYGLTSQSLDNITFGSGRYGLGYYNSYTNSNIRCESNGGYYWYKENLGLTSGQKNYELTLNP